MNPGGEEFVRQTRAIGLETEVHGDRCTVPHTIAGGRFKGTVVRVGFEPPPDFPRNPPSGFHVSPALLPLNPSASEHPARVHPSEFGAQFGGDWMYLSRPLHGWRGTEPVSKLLAHVDHILETS